MRPSLRLLSAGAAAVGVAASLLTLTGSDAVAAGADPLHVVVYRVGDGSSALSNAAAPVLLDRFTSDGTLEGTVAVPTGMSGAQHALTASGLSRSEGRLSLSPDGTLLAFAGYDAAPGTQGPADSYVDVNGATVNVTESLTASDPASVGRVVGLLDGSQAVDTSTAVVGAGVPHVARAATTVDGNQLWLGGSDGGVLSTTRGATSAAVVLSPTGLDTTGLAVAGGQLLATGAYDGQPTQRVVTVGAGTPTSGAAVSGLGGLPANLLPGGFAALDLTGNGFGSTGLDTLYVANATEKAGAVDKFVFDGSTWGKQGTLPLEGVLSVTARASGSLVQIVATTPTGLWSTTETDGTAAGFATSGLAQVASAPGGSEFRGVALAPTGDALSKPTVAFTNPDSGGHVASNSAALTVTGTATALRGIGAVSVQLDGGTAVPATVDGGSWSATLDVTDLAVGEHTLTATASDTGATPATATVNRGIVRDAAPAVAFSTPGDGQHVSYLTSSIPVRGTASAYQGIAAVTVKVDNAAPVSATLSSGSWARTVATNALAVGTHTLTVTAREAGSNAVTTVSRTFVRDGVPAGSVGPGSYSFTNRLVTRSGGWTLVSYGASPDRRALRTSGTSYVRFTSYGRSLDLHFQRRPDAGQLRITIDGRASLVDLRSASTGDLTRAIRGLSAARHTVLVQALHRHSAGSNGYVVLLGSLRVYA